MHGGGVTFSEDNLEETDVIKAVKVDFFIQNISICLKICRPILATCPALFVLCVFLFCDLEGQRYAKQVC